MGGVVVVWVGVVGLSAPLGRPVALTLALSRLAGEGMVCGVALFFSGFPRPRE